MTKRFALLAVLLLIGTAAFAQNASISVFASQIRGGWTSNNGSSYDADYGIGAEYWFTPRVSAAVTVSRHSSVAATTVISNGYGTTTFGHINEYPVDAVVRYRFAGSERWKPYLGGGVRAVRGFNAFRERSWDFAPAINGGVTFMITHKLGLDFDGTVAASQPRYTGVDQFRASLGLSWRF